MFYTLEKIKELFEDAPDGLRHDMTGMYHAYHQWQDGNDPDILDEYPCQELIQVMCIPNPTDWSQQWSLVGGCIYKGRMIARRDDKVWSRFSQIGKPWEPFRFGSGLGAIDIDRDEAIELGVIKPGTRVKSGWEVFEDQLPMDLSSVPPEYRDIVRLIVNDMTIG